MLHVLLGQGGDPNSTKGAPSVVVRRCKDEIRIGVNLGPDAPATFLAERGWLSRMAMRYGGRLELDGSMQSLVLAADVDSHRRELESLQKELAAAQAQGEAYARELAAVFRSGDTAPSISNAFGPSSRSSLAPTSASDGLAVLVAAVRAIGADLRGILAAIGRDIVPLRDVPGEAGEIAASVARHVTGASQIVADLARLGTCPVGELPRVADVAELVREVVASERTRAARRGVELVFRAPADAEEILETGALTVLVQLLLDYAIEASPTGTAVTVDLTETPSAFLLTFDDAGAVLPPAAQGSVLSRDFDALALGRPQGLALIAASTLAAHLRIGLELDAGPQGGTRSRLHIPRHGAGNS
jgi:signal transduction histidine kinase